jgi:hypothetical protein
MVPMEKTEWKMANGSKSGRAGRGGTLAGQSKAASSRRSVSMLSSERREITSISDTTEVTKPRMCAQSAGAAVPPGHAKVRHARRGCRGLRRTASRAATPAPSECPVTTGAYLRRPAPARCLSALSPCARAGRASARRASGGEPRPRAGGARAPSVGLVNESKRF